MFDRLSVLNAFPTYDINSLQYFQLAKDLLRSNPIISRGESVHKLYILFAHLILKVTLQWQRPPSCLHLVDEESRAHGMKIIQLTTGHDWEPATPSSELVLLTPGSPASPGQALNQLAFQSKAKKSYFHLP